MKKANDVLYDTKGTQFSLDPNYALVKFIEKKHSINCIAINKTTNQQVYIKKIVHLLDNQQIIKEIKILIGQIQHENIIQIQDMYYTIRLNEYIDLYVVYQAMQISLNQLIYSKSSYQDDHIKYFTYQILKGLSYLHSLGLIHGSLTSKSILTNENDDVIIKDFQSCSYHSNQKYHYQPLSYMPPELIFDSNHTQSQDIYSVGCLIAELLARKPLFTGKDQIDQINQIVQVLGNPSDEYVSQLQNQKAKEYLLSLPEYQKQNLKDIFAQGEANEQVLDLVQQMIEFEPNKRLTVEQCLKHPYFQDVYDLSDFQNVKIKIDMDFVQYQNMEDILQVLKSEKLILSKGQLP